MINNRVYDILKWVTQYLLPASATLYFALSSIWGLPYGEQVVGTLAAITAFLGAVLGISSYNYNKVDRSDGVLQIDTSDPTKDMYRIELKNEVDSLKSKKVVELKVNPNADLSHREHSL